MLLSLDHTDRLYGADDLTNALNVAADAPDGARVDATMLLRAFLNEAADEFELGYHDYFCHTNNDDVVYVRIEMRSGRHDRLARKSIFIGRFSSFEEGRRAHVVRWNISMDDGVRAGLVTCLEGISRRRAKKRKSAAADVSPDEGGESIADRQPLVAVQVQPPPEKPSTVIYYILNGRVGKMVIPSNGLLIESKLRKNLLPGDDGDENALATRNYVTGSHGSNQCWIPAGSTAYPSNHLTHLKKQAKIVANWQALFDGGQCLFSERFIRTLSQFSLHNMRGSDEGTEMVIAGTIKGLAEEVGLQLPSASLARGCPSRKTLARGDKRLAADCLVSVVNDIRRSWREEACRQVLLCCCSCLFF